MNATWERERGKCKTIDKISAYLYSFSDGHNETKHRARSQDFFSVYFFFLKSHGCSQKAWHTMFYGPRHALLPLYGKAISKALRALWLVIFFLSLFPPLSTTASFHNGVIPFFGLFKVKKKKKREKQRPIQVVCHQVEKENSSSSLSFMWRIAYESDHNLCFDLVYGKRNRFQDFVQWVVPHVMSLSRRRLRSISIFVINDFAHFWEMQRKKITWLMVECSTVLHHHFLDNELW